MEKSYKPTILKIGDNITFGPSEQMAYEFKPGYTYQCMYDNRDNTISFTETGEIELPKKMYVTDNDEKFINRVLTHYNNSETGVTGVILEGVKGAGKTVTMKAIAKKANLPVFILTNKFSCYALQDLFEKLSEFEACFIIDELDKFGDYYDTNKLLDCFDGTVKPGKKLIILTCNELDKTNKYLQDRCSRVRYSRTYKALPNDLINLLVNDRIENKERTEEVTKFIVDKFKLPSFDNVNSFIVEVNEFPNEELKSLVEDMNIKLNK